LEEKGLPFDENLVALDNPWTEGRRAIQRILDERKLRPGRDFDALCSASDLLSFEAATLLEERGWKIPQDMALAGFNDSEESNLLSPTFTTVRMPLDRQALQAFRMLLELLEGKKPGDRTLKTNLVLRQSCGCRTPAVQKAGGNLSPPTNRAGRLKTKPAPE
jgi:DNA-binding LacI/PurR family transcriptional regulator